MIQNVLEKLKKKKDLGKSSFEVIMKDLKSESLYLGE